MASAEMSDSGHLRMECSVCGGGIEFPRDGVGQLIPCPHCGNDIELQNRAKPPALPPPLPASAAEALQPQVRDHPVTCPRCGSTQITAYKRGFGSGSAIAGAVLLGPIGLLGGLFGSGKIQIACLS